MPNKYHIYIPSKGRSDNCLTAILLKKEGIPFTIMVEPQDYDDYRRYYPKKNLLVLKKNSGGLAYARNSALEASSETGAEAHWQMDDDIKGFFKRKEGKNKKISAARAIKKLEKIFDSYTNVAVIGHRHSAFAFSYSDKYSYNHSPSTCFLVKNGLGIKWRKNTIEDADYGLQVLTSGWTTLVTNRYIFSAVPHNKQKGGLSATDSLNDPIFKHYEKLASTWPLYYSVRTLETGHKKLVNHRAWSKFKHRPTKKEEA